MVNADATIASVHCTVLYIVQRVAELYGGWPDPRVGLGRVAFGQKIYKNTRAGSVRDIAEAKFYLKMSCYLCFILHICHVMLHIQ